MEKYDLKTEKLAEGIDWLSYSSKSTEEWGFPSYILDDWKPIHPLQNYTHGQKNKQGVLRFWNTTRDTQGRYVIFGGSVLPTFQEYQQEFLQWVSMKNVKPTRIDFCVDITHSNFNPKAVVSQLRERKVKTHAKAIPKYTDDWLQGFTQYVGLKTSETYTRIYDKKVEQKTDYPWIRIETVYQGQRAEAAFASYIQHKSASSLIKSHVDFPEWRAWNRVLRGRKCKLHYVAKESNTRAWLLSQVCKCIAGELLLDDDQRFLFQLMDRIREEYRVLSPDDEIDW